MPEHSAQSSDIEQVLPAGFKVAKWLGVGNFGKVCRAKGQGGFECAFKIIEMTRGKAVGLKEFRALRVIRRIKPHRNLIEYLGVWLITSEGDILDNADQIEDEDLQKLDVAELIIQMPLAVKSLEVRLKEVRREFRTRTDRQAGDLPGIPLPELLPYMRGVAEALDHLHSPIHPLSDKGLGWIMHRDIKPANILIDRTGNVLVADYGVARAVGTNVKSTQSGAGTPIYSAPEQITDRVDVVDPGSDQYSLAITYYELRTGTLPFKDDVMGDVNSLKLAHTLGKLDFTLLPRNEVSVLKKATHRTVNQRYPSCVEFIDELWKANGVMPMQSGFIQRPVARVPQTDSSPDFGPTPPPQPTPAAETREKTGSRTPFELENAPDIKPAVRDPEPPPPAPKGSGTLLLGDLVRSTPFQAAPFPPPASDENLPIAPPLDDEAPAAPWEQPTAKTKSKSSIDINTEPAKGSWHPAATARQSKTSIDIQLPHGHGTEPKRGKNPLLLIGGGIGLAAAVAGGVFIAMNQSGDPPVEKPRTSEVAKNTDPDEGVKPKPPDENPNKSEGKGPEVVGKEPPKNPPIDEAPANFTQALNHLAKVGDGDLSEINSALTLLKTIPASHTQLGAPAQTLATQWSTLRDLLAKQTLNLDEAQTVSEWMPPTGMKADQESNLRRVYMRLKAANPTAGIRLQTARSLARGDAAFFAVLGAPATVQGFPRVAVQKLDDLLGLAPADATIRQHATALQKAWATALEFDRSLSATRDVTVKEIEAARDAMRAVSNGAEIEPADRVPLRDFYRVRLAHLIHRFALKPVGLATAREWGTLSERLPKSNELDSPWLELLVAEGSFLALALESPIAKGEVAVPAASRLEPRDLREYRTFLAAELNWLNAKTPQQRRDHAETLLETSAASTGLLTVDSRKDALGAIFATTASRDFKQAATTPDAAFTADEKNLDAAKKCLLQANQLLAGRTAYAPVHLQVRRDLLRASAFPKIDAPAAKVAAITRADIESANAPEQLALWFAFARTRELGTPAGVADAVFGYEKVSQSVLKDLDSDLAPLVKLAGSLQEFLSAVPEAQKADTASKLFLPLVRELFPRRAKLKDPERKLLAELAGTAWKIAKTDDLELLYSFVRLEVNGEKLENSAASSLHNRVGTARSRALLGLVQLRNAKGETNQTAKVGLLELGTGNVEKSLELLKNDDPDKLADLLAREMLSGHCELARTHELTGRDAKISSASTDGYKRAIASWDKVQPLMKGRSDFTAEMRESNLALGRCHWALSNDANAWKERLSAARSALGSIATGTPEYIESRYWHILVNLYEADLIRHDGKLNFAAEKSRLLSRRTSKPADLDGVLKLLEGVPASERGAYALEVLEWRACIACARANASNEMNDSDRTALFGKALKALDDLANADALCGAVRRLEFLSYRAGVAAARNGDQEFDAPEIKRLWGPPAQLLAPLEKLNQGTRLPASPDRSRFLLDAAMSLVQLHAQPIVEPKKDRPNRLSEVLKEALAMKLNSVQLVERLEDLAMTNAIDANKYRSEEKPKMEVAAARAALQTFEAIDRLDPDLKNILAYRKEQLLQAGSYRDYVATRAERAIDIDPKNLKDDPATTDLLIQVDTVLAHAEKLLAQHPNQSESNGRLTTVGKNRTSLKERWFDVGLDAAIEAAEKAGDTAHAKAWKDFKSKRYGKP